MQTKDVDLYLERVERATSEAEKLEATKEFYKLINDVFENIPVSI